jgi:hypothetical protein
MTEYLVVAGRPKRLEYYGPFVDLDAAYAHGAQLSRDDWQVGDVQGDGVHLRYGKNRDSAMRDARSYAVVPLPSDQRSDGHLDPGIVRFLRDGATRPTSTLEQFPGRSNREGIPKEARIGFKIPAGTKGARHEW